MFPARLVLAPTLVRDVPDAEVLRLLGYPADREPGDDVRALMRTAREWCVAHARPAVRLKPLRITRIGRKTITWETSRRGGGGPGLFRSETLARRLGAAGAHSMVAAAISSGREIEGEVEFLTGTGELVEATMLDRFGAALAEWLLHKTEERLRAFAAEDRLTLLPPLGPGHEDWTLRDMRWLLGSWGARSRDVELLPSGMLRPRNALLAVFGLTYASLPEPEPANPCPRCTHAPCDFRRSGRPAELVVD